MVTKNKKNGFPKKIIAIIVGLLVFGVATLFVFRLNEHSLISKNTVTPTPIVQLPNDWTFVSADSAQNTVKVARRVSKGIQPSVVFTKTAVRVADPEAYLQKLEKGIFSAIPSFVITGEKNEPEKGYTQLTAEYINGDKTVYVLQRIKINQTDVQILTASYGVKDASLEKDIFDIFDLLQKVYGN
ncbi:MAG: hypothetical protein WC775_02505 [Patescibacteria group bacterium]|jgi:hypothetical protein